MNPLFDLVYRTLILPSVQRAGIALAYWRLSAARGRQRRALRRGDVRAFMAATRARYPWAARAFAMTTKNHTDVTVGAPANASVFNSVFGQLDSALADLEAQVADFVASGGLAGTSASLTISVPALRAFVKNVYVQVVTTPLTVTLNQDTYVDVDSSGVLHMSGVANNAAAPAIFANSIRLFKAVSGATSVTSVTDLRPIPAFSGQVLDWGGAGYNVMSVRNPSGAAKGDGVTDDTGSVQSALNMATPTNAGACRTILPPAFTFVTGALTVYPNTDLEINVGATLKQKNANNVNYISFPTQNGPINKVRILGPGTIDGNGVNQTGGFAVLNLKPSDAINGSIDGLTVRDLTVKNAYTQALYIIENQGGSSGSKRVENCTFDNYGIAAIGFGVYFDYAPGAVCEGCTFRNSNARDAAELGHAGKYRFVYNTIYDSGVNYPFASDSTIAYNIIGTTVAGEGINNDSWTADRMRIVGNWVNASPSAQYGGIRCVGADCVVSDNYLTVAAANTNTKGIMVSGAGARIHDNRVVGVAGAGTLGYGIDNEASANTIIHDNYISGPFAQGIAVEHDDWIVHDNKIDGPLVGILLYNTATIGRTIHRLNVHDNTLLNNATTGIDPQNQFDPSNQVRNNYGYNPEGVQAPAFAASFTPNLATGNVIEIGALTANITINNVVAGGAYIGQTLTLVLTQDGTGGRTATWGGTYKTNWQPATAANAISSISFRFDGTNWQMTAGQISVDALGNALVQGVLSILAANRIDVTTAGTLNLGTAFANAILLGQAGAPTTAAGALITNKDRRISKQTPAFAASPAPDPTLGEIYAMAALTGAVTVANPVNAVQGQRLLLIWTQDGTGGRTVTYSGTNWRSVGIVAQVTTLSTVTIDEAVCVDGTIWRVNRLVTGQTI